MRRRVAILLESSLEVSRRILNGIVGYMERHEPWTIDFIPGALCEQRLPEQWQGDGIIARIPSPAEALRLAAHPAPKVIFDPLDDYRAPAHPLSRWPRVDCDNLACGRSAAEYFIGRGFRSFSFIDTTPASTPALLTDRSWPKTANWRRLRLQGFRDALARRGFDCAVYALPTKRLEVGNANIEQPRLIRFLRELPKPLAVFCPNDARGRQVTDACLAAGIHVPYQVAVLGVNDDSTICGFSQPPLSSIPLDAETAGRKAAIALAALMEGRTRINNYTYQPLPVVTRASTLSLQTDDELVIAMLEEIRATRGFRLRASDFAERHDLSLRQLEKRFSAAIGRSLGSVIRETCFTAAMDLVKNTDTPFKDIAAKAGHQSVSHFADAFRARFGITMSAARHGQTDQYSTSKSTEPPFGRTVTST